MSSPPVKTPIESAIVRVRISLEGTDPEVWRQVDVPAFVTLKQLHAVIQAATGWEDDHLYRFERGRDSASKSRTRLGDLAAARLKRLAYVYDFGDEWRHDIRIEKTLPVEPAPGTQGWWTAARGVRPRMSAACGATTNRCRPWRTPTTRITNSCWIGTARSRSTRLPSIGPGSRPSWRASPTISSEAAGSDDAHTTRPRRQ